MKVIPLLGMFALSLALLSPATALAETWVETGHYKMQVDTDSIRKAPDGRVYFVWKTTMEGMIQPPQNHAVDCATGLYYLSGSAKGEQMHPHSAFGRLIEFVCSR